MRKQIAAALFIAIYLLLVAPNRIEAQGLHINVCDEPTEASGNEHDTSDRSTGENDACYEINFEDCFESEPCVKWLNNLRFGPGLTRESEAPELVGSQEVVDNLINNLGGGIFENETGIENLLNNVTSSFALDRTREEKLRKSTDPFTYEAAMKRVSTWSNLASLRAPTKLALQNPQVEDEEADTPTSPNACASFGSNIGYEHPSQAGLSDQQFSQLTSGRPITLLFKISGVDPDLIPSHYWNASPLIVRLTNFKFSDSIAMVQRYATNVANTFSGKSNVIIVVGNEPNNPDENYCDGSNGLDDCGRDYDSFFSTFVTAVKAVDSSIKIAPAPLDLVNEGGATARTFRDAAGTTYKNASVIAINSYCSADAAQSCLVADINFYQNSNAQKILTEYGPLLDYHRLPQTGLQDQVTFIEANCSLPSSLGISIVTPLLKNSCGGDEWLQYKDGILYTQVGQEQDPTCTDKDSDTLGKKYTNNVLYNWWLGTKEKYNLQDKQVYDVAYACREHIIPSKDLAIYQDNVILTRHPSPIYPGGPTDYDLCHQLEHDSNEIEASGYPSIIRYEKGFIKAWNQGMDEVFGKKEASRKRTEYLAINPTPKTAVTGFYIVTKSEQDITPCESNQGLFSILFSGFKDPTCYVNNFVSQVIDPNDGQKLEVIPILFQGGAAAGISTEVKLRNYMLAKNADAVKNNILDSNHSYDAACPSGCWITQKACENMVKTVSAKDPEDGGGPGTAKVYQYVVNAACDQNVGPTGAVELAQYSGATSPATPWEDLAASFFHALGIEISPEGNGGLSKVLLTSSVVAFDRNLYYGQVYSNIQSRIKKIAPPQGVEEKQMLAAHSVNANLEVRYRNLPPIYTEVDCAEGVTGPCYEEKSAHYEINGARDDIIQTEFGSGVANIEYTDKWLKPDFWTKGKFILQIDKTTDTLACDVGRIFPSLAGFFDIPSQQECETGEKPV